MRRSPTILSTVWSSGTGLFSLLVSLALSMLHPQLVQRHQCPLQPVLHQALLRVMLQALMQAEVEGAADTAPG